jgi:hypothetical protein
MCVDVRDFLSQSRSHWFISRIDYARYNMKTEEF